MFFCLRLFFVYLYSFVCFLFSTSETAGTGNDVHAGTGEKTWTHPSEVDSLHAGRPLPAGWIERESGGSKYYEQSWVRCNALFTSFVGLFFLFAF